MISREEAKSKILMGWNIRCNLCGDYGADWVPNARPGWGSLALCPTHKKEYDAEIRRHGDELLRIGKINFEQDIRSYP
jgi:hypothetical protein